MPDKLDFQAIADAALQHATAWVPDWLRAGVREGHEWRCGSLRGDAGRSLAVNLVTGRWADFSTDEKGGDLISLYAAIFTAGDMGRAARELQQKLGMQPTVSTESAKPRRPKSNWSPIVPTPAHATATPIAHPIRGRSESHWNYRDRDGALLGQVHRFRTSDGGKEILPCVWAKDSDSGREEWRWMQFPEPRPLYGLDRMADRPYVLGVEGEKCVDAAYGAFSQRCDVVTWPGGGKAASRAYWRSIAGRKVILWPDCDAKRHRTSGDLLPEQEQPGIMAVERIAQILIQLGCEVRIVRVPAPGDVADGWDVADALADGKSPDELWAWITANLREPQNLQSAAQAVQPAMHTEDVVRAQADMGAPTPEPAAASPYWKTRLLQKPRGGYEDCKENVALALEYHPQLTGLLGYNEFTAHIEKLKPPPWPSPDGEWTAEDDLELSMWLSINAHLLFKATTTIGEGVKLVAHRNRLHPVRAWLESLEWDGQDRLSIWLRDCLGVEESPYSRLVGALWLRQAVNRIMNPGCKGDYVLILEGVQGLMKSSALRVLGGEWFSDAPLDLNSKDAFMSIMGTWIYEIAELDAFNRSEATRIKAFLTQAHDRYRPPYGSRMVTQLRQTVFAATTNTYEYHKDPTGNRRFWSVLCTGVDLSLIAEIREQLFAQALHELRAGEQIYPTRAQEAQLIVPEQQMREIVDPWLEAIALWLDEPERATVKRFTSAEILTGAIKMELAKIDGQRSATTRIGSIMVRLGWKKGRRNTGHRMYYYERPEPEHPVDSGGHSMEREYEPLPL